MKFIIYSEGQGGCLDGILFYVREGEEIKTEIPYKILKNGCYHSSNKGKEG